MGLANIAPQSTDTVTKESSSSSLGTQANEILRGAQTDEAGNIILPEGTPTELREFIQMEKMRRDTQSAYTKGQQENATLKAENEALLAKVGSASISPADQTRLDELKYNDPDAWYIEKQRLEAEAKTRGQESIQSTLTTARETANQAHVQQEMVRREKILADFTVNSGLQLTEDMINNDVPPRIQNKLKEGMEFGAWLYEVAEYLKTPKVVENELVTNVTNIGSAGSEASNNANDPVSYGADTIY